MSLDSHKIAVQGITGTTIEIAVQGLYSTQGGPPILPTGDEEQGRYSRGNHMHKQKQLRYRKHMRTT